MEELRASEHRRAKSRGGCTKGQYTMYEGQCTMYEGAILGAELAERRVAGPTECTAQRVRILQPAILRM